MKFNLDLYNNLIENLTRLEGLLYNVNEIVNRKEFYNIEINKETHYGENTSQLPYKSSK